MFRCMPFLACNRQVDSLDKRQCNLSQIPEDVARYARSLEELMLDSNHIKELTKPLFRLVKLRRLQLSDNEIYKIPPDISSLSNLVELDLSKNDISDIPENIKFCKSLRALNLGSNPITRLPASITQLRTLTQLGLNDVSLTQLPADIGNLSSLRELDLRDNLLRSLPDSISYLAQLQRLDLGCNELYEMPAEIGQLTNLQEFYADGNDFETLPKEIGSLKSLQVLDVSECKLELIPEEIGELPNMTDLVLSFNSLESLPHSIGRLKKLSILKVDKNRLIELTPAIGSCTGLQELILTENFLQELPSSVANLKLLSNLNVDKNSLVELPTTIGSCSNLGVLSMRDNNLVLLPMEIGKLEKLRVLDVSGNRLTYLPYTIGVLSNLQALWLSENQSQPLLKLQQDQDQRTGMKVLTCYLLPQQDSPPIDATYMTEDSDRRPTDGGTVGGPIVHFADQSGEEEGDERLPIGKFERKDTPHPKPQHAVPQKPPHHIHPDRTHVDGRVIHHHEYDQEPVGARNTSFELRRPSEDALPVSNISYGSSEAISSPKRSAPPVPPPRLTPVRDYIQASQVATGSGDPAPLADLGEDIGDETEDAMRSGSGGVAFANDTEDRESRLKRKNTPHYLKHAKIGDPESAQAKLADILSGGSGVLNSASPQNRSLRPLANGVDNRTDHRHDLIPQLAPQYEEQVKIVHRLDGGLGLSIAGGTDSPPFNPDKPEDEGIFISKVTEGGPADRSGLKRGDKLIAVNGNTTVGVSHKQAVEYMKKAGDAVTMKVGREVLKPTSNGGSSGVPSPDASFSSDTETISTTIKVLTSGPGFSIAGGKGSVPFRAGDDAIYISYITKDGPADRDGKLKVGDRVLVINGTNVRSARHDQAVALLTGYENEVHLVVQRDKCAPIMTPLTPLKVQGKHLGDLSLDRIEPPLAQSSPVNSLQKNVSPPTASHPAVRNTHDDASPYPVEKIVVKKLVGSLGLSIVGGSDHCHHPFGVAGPGVFISKLVPGGAAAKCKKLRIGDRILAVNGTDVSRATHEDAVGCLKSSTGKEVSLTVRHDPEPPGLREFTIKRKGKEAMGLIICGGVRSPPANPLDRTDEGIFIEEVHTGGAASRDGRLNSGMRILEVNDVSLLGSTQDDATNAIKNAGSDVRVMVCEGFDPSLMSLPSVAVAAASIAEARSKSSTGGLSNSRDEPAGILDGRSSSTTESSMASPEIRRPTVVAPSFPESPKKSAILPPSSFSPAQRLRDSDRPLPSPPKDLPISSQVEEEFKTSTPSYLSPTGRRPLIGSAAPRPYVSRVVGTPPRPMPTTPTHTGTDGSSSGIFSAGSLGMMSSGLGASTSKLPSTTLTSSATGRVDRGYGGSSPPDSYPASMALTSKSLPSLVMPQPPPRHEVDRPYMNIFAPPPLPPRATVLPMAPPPPPAAAYSAASAAPHSPSLSSSQHSTKPSSAPPPPPKPSRPTIGVSEPTASSEAPLNTSTDETPDPVTQSRIPSAKQTQPFQPPGATASSPTTPGATPEKLSFGSKLKKFEKEIVEHAPTVPSTSAPPSKLPKPQLPPKKFALVSENDVKRMKEEEQTKPPPPLTPSTPDENINFLLNTTDSMKSSGPTVVRTKKAENRAKAADESLNDDSVDSLMSPAEKRAVEAEKRAKWRADRLKSLEADALKAESIMRKVMQTSETIPEQHEQTEKESEVGSEVYRTQTEEIDPESGDVIIRTYEHEQVVRKFEVETTDTRVLAVNHQEIGFIDDGSSQRSGHSN